jgi:protein required for attachment to host cells
MLGTRLAMTVLQLRARGLRIGIHRPQTMNNHMETTWILVADRAGATLFKSHGRRTQLERIAQIPNPRGRLKAGQVDADRPGRAFDRHGAGRHAHSTEHSVPDHIETEFVTQLVDQLEQGRLRSAFDCLVLIAPAKMLGKLRGELPEPLRKLLVGSVAKDLAHSDEHAVREQLLELALL